MLDVSQGADSSAHLTDFKIELDQSIINPNQVFLICDVSKEESLTKYNCYKRSTNFTQLRMSALRVLAACHYIPEYEAKIFKVSSLGSYSFVTWFMKKKKRF